MFVASADRVLLINLPVDLSVNMRITYLFICGIYLWVIFCLLVQLSLLKRTVLICGVSRLISKSQQKT